MRHAYHPMMEYIPVGLLEYTEEAEVMLMLFYFDIHVTVDSRSYQLARIVVGRK